MRWPLLFALANIRPSTLFAAASAPARHDARRHYQRVEESSLVEQQRHAPLMRRQLAGEGVFALGEAPGINGGGAPQLLADGGAVISHRSSRISSLADVSSTALSSASFSQAAFQQPLEESDTTGTSDAPDASENPEPSGAPEVLSAPEPTESFDESSTTGLSDVAKVQPDAPDDSPDTSSTATGEQEPTRELPQWAVITIASVATCALLVILNRIAACLGSPIPFFGASDVQKLRAEYEKSLESTRALEDLLRAKEAEEAAAARVEMEQALNVAPHEELEEEAIADAPEPAESLPLPSREELLGEMMYRTKQVDDAAGRPLKAVVSNVAPVIAKANQAASVIQGRVGAIKDRVQNMANNEALDLVKVVATTMGHDLDEQMIRQHLPEWFNFGDDLGDLDSPPVALLLAGIFAPAQLHALAAGARMEMGWSCVVLAMGVLVVALDARKPCDVWHVSVWMWSLLVIQSLSFVSSAVILGKANYAIVELKEDQEVQRRSIDEGGGALTGNAVWNAFFNLRGSSGYCIKAQVQGLVPVREDHRNLGVLVWQVDDGHAIQAGHLRVACHLRRAVPGKGS